MIGFILGTLKPFKFWIIGQLTVCIIWAVDLSLRPYILKIIIDKIPHLSSDGVVQELIWPIAGYLSMTLLTVIIFRFLDFIWLKLNPPLKRHIGDKLMKKMMKHSLVVFHNHFAGNLANKIKDVMSGVPDLLRVTINQFFSHFLALVIAIFTVQTINYKFSILLLAWVIVFVVGSTLFAKRAKELCVESAEVRSGVMGLIVDILGNIANVHLFSAKEAESRLLKVHLDNYVAADQKRDWWFLGMFSFQGISFVIYQAIGFAFLLSGFKNGSVTAGDFALLISINIAIINSLWSLSADILKASELIGNIEQGLRIALAPPDIQDKSNAGDLKVNHGKVVFDSVKFHYKGTKPLFQNKSDY